MRLLLPVPVLLLVLAACGGGGAGAGGDGGDDGGVVPPLPSLSGWYVFSQRPTDSGLAYVTASIAGMEATPTGFWLGNREYAADGDAFVHHDPSPTSPDRIVRRYHRLDTDRLEGTHATYAADVLVSSIDTRLDRTTAPTGTFTMAGTITSPIASVDTANGYALDSSAPAAHAVNVFAADARQSAVLTVILSRPLPVPPGTYDVGGLPGQVVAVVQTGSDFGVADAGSVTFTTIDATRLEGSYSLTIPGGGSVTGTFDVPVLLHN